MGLPRLLEIKPARVVFGHAVGHTEHLVALAPERHERLLAALLALVHLLTLIVRTVRNPFSIISQNVVVMELESCIVRYYKSLPPKKQTKVRAFLESMAMANQGHDQEARSHMKEADITRDDLIEFHKQTFDYMIEILPAEAILKQLNLQ